MKKGNRTTVKTRKSIAWAGLSLSLLLFLSGCVETKNGVPTGEGWVYQWLVEPMGRLIQFFAEDQALGFGMAIIIVTLLVRLLILPLGIYQARKSTYQAEKMNYLKPILAPIQEKIKNASTQEEQLAAQQELFATQKEYGVSMFGGIGCLPLLIQMPFFTALFYAARYTEGIATANFMGIHLGEPSLILTAAAGLAYFAQSLLMQVGLDEEQKRQMKSMMLMNPLMIVFFSWSAPAGVTLYWVIGGIVGIVTQALTNFIIKPKIRKQVEEEYKNNPPKPRQTKTKDVTPQSSVIIEEKSQKEKRNAGKQRSR